MLLPVIIIGSCIFLINCGEKIEEFDGFLKSEVELMLSNKDAKTWTRIISQVNGQPREGACLDSVRYQFTYLNNKDDTSGLVFISPFENCTAISFCDVNPEVCTANESFCSAKPDQCKNDEGYYFAGSWYIKEPDIKNANVNQVEVKYPSETLNIQINLITSQHLELTTIKGDITLFEKFIAE